jgi:DNA topoisomerase-1
MKKNLVVVESPAKAKTISKFLGPQFYVLASMGHIRDLPKKRLGVNTRGNFEPEYIIPYKAQKTVAKLKKAVSRSKYLYLATDLDREGEAIAWHVMTITKPKQTPKRIVFGSITKAAIQAAIKKPREIDRNLVDAQQARRILDRLVGYRLSPLLWRKVASGLSAGRVQSVAVRLIVEREEEIRKFKPQEYWTIEADLRKKTGEETKFTAFLAEKDGQKIDKLDIKNEKEAQKIKKDLSSAPYRVLNIKREEKKRYPSPPFTTSTMQQEAYQKLGFPAKKTMILAQRLYEGAQIAGERVGLITYMRTDSVNLAPEAMREAERVIKKTFGEKYYAGKPRFYKVKSKGAQEAHEAIRPTNFFRTPKKIEKFLDRDQARLYDLIWKRALATQMAEAVVDSTSVNIKAKNYIFRANGSIIKFPGFIKVYVEDADDARLGSIAKSRQENGIEIGGQIVLPPLKKDELLNLLKLNLNQHFTEPSARYTEATLIKTLEKYGIGRPSTYAPTISTIQDRNYVSIKEGKFIPEDIGILVTKLLKKHFPEIVDYKFTAKVEDELDTIADGDLKWQDVVREFYQPFNKQLAKKSKELSKSDITEEKLKEKCPKCHQGLIVKMGRFGKFVSCTNYPKCKYSRPFIDKKIEKKVEGEKCEKCGGEMLVKEGRFGPFLACKRYPKCRFTKALPQKGPKMKCPGCGKGEVVLRHTKRGKKFWGCSTFPKCKWASWTEPKPKKK